MEAGGSQRACTVAAGHLKTFGGLLILFCSAAQGYTTTLLLCFCAYRGTCRAAELLSPFADKRRDAAWYGVDPTCNPPRDRTLLQQQIDLLDQYTWVAEEAVTHGVRLNHTVITNSLEGLSTEGLGLPLTKMFSGGLSAPTQAIFASGINPRAHVGRLHCVTNVPRLRPGVFVCPPNKRPG